MRLISSIILILFLTISVYAREKVNINFSNLAINDFVKLVAKVTGKNILINYKINGSIDLVSSSAIYDDELMSILVSVLESKGYTVVNNGSYYMIVRSNEAAKHANKVVKKGRTVRSNLMVTQTIKIKNENVDIVAAKIRYLISRTAKLMTMKESNTLIITDYPKNIETIKKVIKEIDDNSKFIVDVVHIQNTEAKKRLKIIKFFDKYGLDATIEAFGVSRRTIYRYKATFKRYFSTISSLIISISFKFNAIFSIALYFFSVKNLLFGKSVFLPITFFAKAKAPRYFEKSLNFLSKFSFDFIIFFFGNEIGFGFSSIFKSCFGKGAVEIVKFATEIFICPSL